MASPRWPALPVTRIVICRPNTAASGVENHVPDLVWLDALGKIGAGEGARTLDPDLGKVVLYH